MVIKVYHNYFNLGNWLKWDQQKGQKIIHINEIQAIWTKLSFIKKFIWKSKKFDTKLINFHKNSLKIIKREKSSFI